MIERQYRLGYVDRLLGGVEVFRTFSAADDHSACLKARAIMGDSPRRSFLFDDRFRIVVEGQDFNARFPAADLIYRRPAPGTEEFLVLFVARTPAALKWTALAQDPDDGGPVDSVRVLPAILPRLFRQFSEQGLVVEEDLLS